MDKKSDRVFLQVLLHHPGKIIHLRTIGKGEKHSVHN